MMKRLVLSLLTALAAAALCACGQDVVIGTETDYIHVDGLYVDTAYQDPAGGDLLMVYLCYTVFTPDRTLSVDSRSTALTIHGAGSFPAAHYPGQCDFMASYYYSSYLKDVYVGAPLAVAETFLIPRSALEEGQAITLANQRIPEMDQLTLSTDDLILCPGEEAVAQAADPTGYDRMLDLHTPASPAAAAQVQAAVNGLSWSCYIGANAYQVTFSAPDGFAISTPQEDYQGTYAVEEGFLICHPPDGDPVAIPYAWEGDGSLALDLLAAFDEKDR